MQSMKKNKTNELAVKQTQQALELLPYEYSMLFQTADQLKETRLYRLRTLLHHAKRYSPWYKTRLSHIDENTFDESQLHEIPPLNKALLMRHWDEIVTDRTLSLDRVEKHVANMQKDSELIYLNEKYHVLSTSGSSGLRGIFVYDWFEWNKYALSYYRYWICSRTQEQKQRRLAGKEKTAIVIVNSAAYAMYSMAKTYLFKGSEIIYVPMTLPMKEIVTILNQQQVDVLQGTPTTIFRLCHEAEQGRLDISPYEIVLGGESLYQPIRQRIESTWPQALLFNSFGTSEGLVANNCQANQKYMHINDDACIVEPIDEKGLLLKDKPFKASRLYITNLFNHTLPLIRYELSDQFEFIEQNCDCGIEHQLIKEPQGRPEYDFIYPDNVFVHHLVFVTPFLHEQYVAEYQVKQTTHGADIKIVATGKVDLERLKKIFVQQLATLGVRDPMISFTIVESIEYPCSGKLKRFIKCT